MPIPIDICHREQDVVYILLIHIVLFILINIFKNNVLRMFCG